MMHHIVAAYPDQHLGDNRITLDPMWRSPFGANGYMAATLPILLAFAAVVLLLTCANVATLTLVRFVSRRRELAIRQSLGANRIQLVRQMVLEGVVLSIVAGAVALVLTSWTSKTFAWFFPANSNPLILNGSMDHKVVIGIAVSSLLAGMLCGALPAWRSSHAPAIEVLKAESASISGGSRNRKLLSGLVVAQIALSLPLLLCSGLNPRRLLKTLKLLIPEKAKGAKKARKANRLYKCCTKCLYTTAQPHTWHHPSILPTMVLPQAQGVVRLVDGRHLSGQGGCTSFCSCSRAT
jgi:FtsX-like permease family